MRKHANIAQIRRPYNVVADNFLKIQTYKHQFKVIQDHRYWCQSKAHMQLPISHK